MSDPSPSLLKRIAEQAHDQVVKERSKTTIGSMGPVAISLLLADHPICDLERLEIGQALIPHLRKGENIDTGALRILGNVIKSNLSEIKYFR